MMRSFLLEDAERPHLAVIYCAAFSRQWARFPLELAHHITSFYRAPALLAPRVRAGTP